MILKMYYCQKETKIELSSTGNDWQKVIDAANKRRDNVYRELKNSNLGKLFKNHITKDCYKGNKLLKTGKYESMEKWK